MPTAGKKRFVNFAIVIWVCALALICSFVVLRKRSAFRTTPGMWMSEQYKIRVLLFNNIRGCAIACRGVLRVADANRQVSVTFGPQAGDIEVTMFHGRISVGQHIFGTAVRVMSDEPFVISVSGRLYRGNLVIIAEPDGQSVDVINVVPIEAYLAGVVGAEMPSYWEPEALKAQAVASRTYCLYHKRRYGPGREWDVRRTQASQVYKGLAAETATVWNAVNQTCGQVLVCGHSDGSEGIFPTYFASICGGHTEDSVKVFGDDYSALKGVECRYCRKTARADFFDYSAVEFDASEVSRRLVEHYPTLERLGSIEDIRPTQSSVYEDFERITKVLLVGSTGKSQELEAENLRLTIDSTGNKIKSTACKIARVKNKFRFSDGRGYGHGVGMCQHGAEGLAREGAGYARILGFYYPTTKIRRLY